MGYAAPSAGGDKFVVADHLGHLVVIDPLSLEQVPTDNGLAEAVKADVLDVTTKEVFRNSLIFGRVLVKSLVPLIGKSKVLGTVAQGKAKAGQNAPWILENAASDPKAVQAAQAAEEEVSFSQPAYEKPQPVAAAASDSAPF